MNKGYQQMTKQQEAEAIAKFLGFAKKRASTHTYWTMEGPPFNLHEDVLPLWLATNDGTAAMILGLARAGHFINFCKSTIGYACTVDMESNLGTFNEHGRDINIPLQAAILEVIKNG